MKRLVETLFYWFNVRWIQVLLFFSSSRDIKGRENVPRTGPLIMACNHQNNTDPPVVADAIPRKISWLTKAEWFRTPVVGWMFKTAGMIPVRRFEADLHALRQSQELLTNGGCLGMFPEGTRGKGLGLQQGEPGSALIALRSGAPVLPVAVWGNEHVRVPRDIIGRTKTHVRIGKTFVLKPAGKKITREDITAGTKVIMRAIAELLPEELRGVYGAPPAGTPVAARSNPEA